MTELMVEAAVRSALLAIAAASLIAALRVKDSRSRLAVSTAVIHASLWMPLAAMLPRLDLPLLTAPAVATVDVIDAGPAAVAGTVPHPVDILGMVYFTGAAMMLTPIAVGGLLTWRLRRASTKTGGGFSEAAIASPVSFGILRPMILLPLDWREWDCEKLAAVLEHESAHIRQRDPLHQAASAVYRAVFWFNPLAWWLHRKRRELAELACDDAVLDRMPDGARYAGILLEFAAAAGTKIPRWGVVAMAEGPPVAARVERVLEQSREKSSMSKSKAIALASAMVVIGLAAAVTTVTAQTPPPAPAAAAPAPPPAPPAAPAQAPAAPAPPPLPPPANARFRSIHQAPGSDPAAATVFVTGGRVFGRGEQSDFDAAQRFGGDGVFVRRGGNTYAIRDAAVLKQAAEQYEQSRRESIALGWRRERGATERSAVDAMRAEMDAVAKQAADLAKKAAELRDSRAGVDEMRAQADKLRAEADAMRQKAEATRRAAEKSRSEAVRQRMQAAEMFDRLEKLVDEAIASGKAKPVK